MHEPTPWDFLVKDVEYIRAKVDKLDDKVDKVDDKLNARLTPLEGFANRVRGVLTVGSLILTVAGAVLLKSVLGL